MWKPLPDSPSMGNLDMWESGDRSEKESNGLGADDSSEEDTFDYTTDTAIEDEETDKNSPSETDSDDEVTDITDSPRVLIMLLNLQS